MSALRSCVAAQAPFARHPALLDHTIVALEDALAVSTVKGGYERGQEMFLRYAMTHGIAQPVYSHMTQLVLVGFVIWVVKILHYKVATARRWLTGVRSLAVDGARPMLLRVVRGLRRQNPAGRRRNKMPITTAVLTRFVELLGDGGSELQNAMMAAVVVGVYGLLRASEVVAKAGVVSLRRRDVRFEDASVKLSLRASKTDYFRQGVCVLLFGNSTNSCPVRWLQRALDAATDKRPDAAVFQGSGGSPVSYQHLLAFIKHLATKAGLPDLAFGCHSMRIGGATSLAAMGCDMHTIRTLGRWESLSYQRYIKLTKQAIHSSQNLLAAHASRPDRGFFGAVPPDRAMEISIDSLSEFF